MAALAGPARADVTVAPPAGDKAGCARLPDGWNVTEMADAAGVKAADLRSARILAWQIDEDDRPLLIHSAILWLESANKRWTLAHIYRHPRDKRTWQLARVFDAPFINSIASDKPPTATELDDFLKDTWWDFKPHGGFKLLGAEVCADAWTRSFGRKPWRSYK